jgi:predicted CopG family antitoxin
MSIKILKHIAVDERNYFTLKRLGNAGDSFNDVISRVLKKLDTEEPGEEEEAGVNE